MTDIEHIDHIKIFVDAFYTQIQADELLAPVFALRIHTNDWEGHLQRMYHFWDTVLFSTPSYKGRPFPKHMHLPIEQAHFDRWTTLFKETIDTHFEGTRADATKARVDKMATLFMAKIDHIRTNPNYKPLL